MSSWSDIVDFSQPLTESGGDDGQSGGEGSNDRIDTHRVNGLLPAIVWDAEKRVRRVVRMRVPGPGGLAAATADPRALGDH